MIEKPRLIIIAGPNGSGKTTITEQFIRHGWIEGCQYINPDFIARDLFGDWNVTADVLKAAQYATELREKCIEQKQNLILESVFSAPDKITLIKNARDKDYFIRVFFIATYTPIINVKRVAYRVLNGGHDVPTPKIISRYYKSISNCAIAAPMIDRLYVYDNSQDNAPPKLLFRADEGHLEKQYETINEWAENIFQAVLK